MFVLGTDLVMATDYYQPGIPISSIHWVEMKDHFIVQWTNMYLYTDALSSPNTFQLKFYYNTGVFYYLYDLTSCNRGQDNDTSTPTVSTERVKRRRSISLNAVALLINLCVDLIS